MSGTKTYRVIINKNINVNGLPRKVNDTFEEIETNELKRLVKHEFLEVLPNVKEKK